MTNTRQVAECDICGKMEIMPLITGNKLPDGWKRYRNADCCPICVSNIEFKISRRSKWVRDDDGDGYHCCVCGADYCTLVEDIERYAYCPHCGAKIDEEYNYEKMDRS